MGEMKSVKSMESFLNTLHYSEGSLMGVVWRARKVKWLLERVNEYSKMHVIEPDPPIFVLFCSTSPNCRLKT